MTDKTETEILLAEAANCRKLAEMTGDPTAREALERIARKHDERRMALESLRAGMQGHQSTDEFSLDRFVIEEPLIVDAPISDGEEMRVA
ncbi:MAG TPA: hypothetical protein VL574_13680 [Stellaceae bacterium]|nr:hypothetical protein [Stellaceae bacterium]